MSKPFLFILPALLFVVFISSYTISSALPFASPPNIQHYKQSPIANAGPNQIVNQGTVVTLDGRASSDPDGDGITSYLWRQISGVPVILSGSNTPNPLFTAPISAAGDTILTFSLTVTDNSGSINTIPSIVHVLVRHAVNQPPLSSAVVPHYPYSYQYLYPFQNQQQQPPTTSIPFQNQQQQPPTTSIPFQNQKQQPPTTSIPFQNQQQQQPPTTSIPFQQQFQKQPSSTPIPNSNTAAQHTNNPQGNTKIINSSRVPLNSLAAGITTKNNNNNNNNTTIGVRQPSAGATTVPLSAAPASGTISGVVYMDSNLNGARDSNELGKSNWKLTLTGVLAGGTTSITPISINSAADGTYTFSGLQPGTYTVTESDLTGWAHTTKAVVNNINIVSGSNVVINFGNIGLSRITAIPFNDINGNGIKDTGEPILSGWNFVLTGTLSNGTAAKSKNVISDASSGAIFFGIYPGTYTLTESDQVGWKHTTSKSLSITAKDTGGSSSYNFGNLQQSGISGIVYYDTNGDLKQDPGDTLVTNWNVALSQNGKVVSTALTGPTGAGYSFTPVSPGTYTVSAAAPNPYVPTQPLNNSYSVTVTSTNSKFTRNFGIFKNPSPLIGGANLNSDLDGFTVEGIAFDTKGFLYVVDANDNLVKKFDNKGNLVTSFGNNILSAPGGLAIDSQGNILVSEEFHKLLKFDPNGNFLTSFGTLGTGTGQLNRPRGITTDPQDNLYVAGGDNNIVQQYDKNGNYLRKIGSGAGGLPWSYLVMLFDVKLDSHGNIFAADTSNNRVQKFDPNGNFLLNIGKSGAAPALSGVGNGQFNKPRAIAIGPNNVLYVADTYNNRIQEFDNNGTFISTFGQIGSAPGQFLNPSGIVVDRSTGNIFVADNGNGRIQIFNSNGQFLSQFKIRLISMEPYFSYIDKSGHLLVSDGANHVVNRFDPNTGSFLSQFGTLGASPGTFHGPRGIAQDQAGHIWVADNYNNRVEKFDANGNFLLTFGTRGTGSGQFNQPRGLVIDSSGNILVSDTQNNRIQKFDPNGNFITSFTTPNMVQPYQITLDKQGNIYAAEEGANHIEKLDSKGKSLMIIGSSGTGSGQFNLPKGVYVDSSGNIYTTDGKQSNIIQKFDATGKLLMAFGSQGTSGINSPPGQFFDPRGILVDSSGKIWVDDTQNDRVQEFDSSGNFIKQISHSQ